MVHPKRQRPKRKERLGHAENVLTAPEGRNAGHSAAVSDLGLKPAAELSQERGGVDIVNQDIGKPSTTAALRNKSALLVVGDKLGKKRGGTVSGNTKEQGQGQKRLTKTAGFPAATDRPSDTRRVTCDSAPKM